MRKGYGIVLTSQAELAAGIVLASLQPPPIPGLSIDDIALGTALAYIPTALAGGVIVAQEKAITSWSDSSSGCSRSRGSFSWSSSPPTDRRQHTTTGVTTNS